MYRCFVVRSADAFAAANVAVSAHLGLLNAGSPTWSVPFEKLPQATGRPGKLFVTAEMYYSQPAIAERLDAMVSSGMADELPLEEWLSLFSAPLMYS
jgi:hypothetical protein